MPFYEYRCTNCNHEFEVLQKISDSPLVNCPKCSEPTLKKLVSAAAFRLKGSGWYETDFKSDKKRNLHEASESKEPAAKKESGEQSATEAATDTKKETAKPKTGGNETKSTAKPATTAAD